MRSLLLFLLLVPFILSARGGGEMAARKHRRPGAWCLACLFLPPLLLVLFALPGLEPPAGGDGAGGPEGYFLSMDELAGLLGAGVVTLFLVWGVVDVLISSPNAGVR